MGRKSMRDRNLALARRRVAGASFAELGQAFGISTDRAREIFVDAVEEGLLQAGDERQRTVNQYQGVKAALRERTLDVPAYQPSRQMQAWLSRAGAAQPRLVPMVSNVNDWAGRFG